MKPAVFLAVFCGVLCSLVSAAPSLSTAAFTTTDGDIVAEVTLTNSSGLRARVLSWGATLVELTVPDRKGNFADVTLGFDELERYAKRHPLFGSVAGRYANRIAGGKFPLDGRVVTLPTNSGANHIHGGARGFDKRNWKAEPLESGAVRLTYVAADGEEGYPGKLTAQVTYTLTERSELRIDYEASTDAPTVLNLTNHTYWNLAGSGDVLGHGLRLYADRYTAVDRALIPTGEIREVKGTPLDFTKAKLVGRDIAQLKGEGLPGGYDHNFVINRGDSDDLAPTAELYDPGSGRMMRIRTSQPGVQIYSANHLKNVAGRGGKTYGPHAGICFETQHYPDSPNHPAFPTTVLRPGETFRSTTVFGFSAH